MIDIDAFEATKNNERTNLMSWIRQLPIVSYGFITEVVTDGHVKVAPIIQENPDFRRIYDVTLIGLSSALLETSVQPQEKDLVLLLSPDRFHPDMFHSVQSREEGAEVIIDNNLNGYSTMAVLGILMSTLKTMSEVQVRAWKTDEGSFLSIDTGAKTSVASTNDFAVSFVSGDGEDHPLLVSVGENRPVTMSRRTALKKRVGFNGKAEEEPVDAPTEEEYSENAPITGTYAAPVTKTFLEKADITLKSDAGLKMSFKKALDLLFEDAIAFVSKKAIQLVVQGSGLLKIGNDVATLKGILDEYNSILSGFDTVGSPANHMTGPKAKAKLALLKQKQGKVFE